MQPWKTEVVCAGRYRPRQFEYHPTFEDVVVFGTLRGEAVVADVASNRVCSSIPSGLSKDKHDSILGLCWLKKSPTRFVVGSSHGCLRLCDAAEMPSVGAHADAAAGALDLEVCNLTSRSNAVQEAVPFDALGASSTKPAVPAQGGLGGQFSEVGRIINKFENFEKLTSVHINSTDDQLLASGYTYGVKLFDLATGQVVREFDDIHEDHINISRFANHSPFVFATSSFDKTVKAWDSRVRADKAPIYTCRSEMGHVMLSFSPDDVFLLTSAVDNEVKQYLALDGRLHMDLEIPKTGMDENFTRSYYTSSGRLILSGSSEEQTVRLYCAQTGRLIHSAEMYPGRKHGSLYVQSLRGDPHHDFQFSVLVNYRDTAYPLEIVTVDMLQGRDGEDLSSLTAYASSSRLSADLGGACVDKEGADVFVVACDRSRFLAHKAVLSCRSKVLEGLLADAAASEGKGKGKSGDVAGAAKLRLRAGPGEDRRTAAAFAARETNRGEGAVTVTASVCLPRAVAPDIVPVIMAFLYTDRLVQEPDFGHDGFAEEYLDPAGQGDLGMSAAAVGTETCHPRGRSGFGGDRYSDSRNGGSISGTDWDQGNGVQRKVAFFEKVLEAAGILRLDRLISLVEWECRQLVNTTTVLSVASVALKQGTEQLLKFCVHFLGTHVHPVLELHGRGCLPPAVQAKVDDERRQRVYALNSESKDPVAPDVVMTTVPPGRANDDAAAAGGTGRANENAAVGDAGGETAAAPAPTVANEALRNASAEQAEDEGNGDNPNEVLPANGAWGAGENGDDAHEDPVDPDPMEETGPDNEADFVNGEEEEEDNDDDGFIDGEVEDDDSSSEVETLSDDDDDEDEGTWLEPSHGGGNLPAAVRRRLVPTVTGHTATAVLGSQMMVLGGGNRRQFHSCRHVLVYDPIERTWSKLATRGNAPAALIYHSCTALEPPWGCPRNLLVFGGNSTHRHINPNLRPKANVSVLDSLTMEWIQPKIRGDPIGVRTRHTAVAVHADFEQHERETVEMDDKSLAGQFEGLTAEAEFLDVDIGENFPAGKGLGKRRAHPPERAQPRDIGGDTNVIIFGGFSPIAGHAFNDVVVLNVHRSRGMFLIKGALGCGSKSNSGGGGSGSSGRGSGAAAAFSSSSGRVVAHPARRRRFSCDSDSDSDSDCEQSESAPSGGSHHGYTYTWVHPMVRGTPPAGRLAHSSAVVRLLDDSDAGSGSSQQAYMVVFGGVGTGQVFNDVSALRCNSPRTLEWERVSVRGRRPSIRYGHSMVPLTSPSGTCGHAKLILFGGTSGHTACNDLFILSVSRGKVDGLFGILAKWERLKIDGIMPCPRSRQTMCQLNGELIVFGGSDENPGTPDSQPISKEVDAFVYHVRPRLRMTLPGPYQCSGFGSGGGDGGGCVGGSASSFMLLSEHSPAHSQAATVRHDEALLRRHERAMAEEVIAHMGLVQAAQERRAGAATVASGGDASRGGAAAPRCAGKAGSTSGAGGATASGREHQQGPAMYPSSSGGIAAHSEGFRATKSGLPRPERGWLPHEHELTKAPIRPYPVKVVWECIRPDAFVFEPGPEPPVVIRPGQLHRDTQTLIGSELFSDVKFRFQAVDFGLPTTPTNTAHYAIVPPPTPTLSPKSGLPIPANAALLKDLQSSDSRRSPRTRSERSGAAGDGGRVGSVAASRLPSYPSDSVGSRSGNDSGSGTVPERGSRRRNLPSVVLRSSAGQEGGLCSPSRSLSPSGGWSIINRPASSSPLGPGHCSAAGGRRRFFGLSKEAEAEAEAALRSEGEGEKSSAPVRDDGTATATSVAEKSGAGVAAGNPVIDAHRFLLSLRSDPMRAMLRSGMKETFASVCLVKDIRPAVFSALLTYIYTDTLQLQRPEDITELLVVANQYTLTDLLSLCEGFLQGVLDEENASHLYHYADSLAMPTFEHRCLTFILRNWRKVVSTEGWMHLPPELRARANAFRTKETHLFMLGQKDHATWQGGEKDMMADWLLDRTPSTSWIEEKLIQETFAKSGDEGWQTASEGDGESDGAAFFSPETQSPTTSNSP